MSASEKAKVKTVLWTFYFSKSIDTTYGIIYNIYIEDKVKEIVEAEIDDKK